jgi:hypothetical protein
MVIIAVYFNLQKTLDLGQNITMSHVYAVSEMINETRSFDDINATVRRPDELKEVF